MAAEIRFVNIGREQPTREERMRGERPGPSLAVAVGKRDTLRRIPLDEQQLLSIITQAADQLERLRHDREAPQKPTDPIDTPQRDTAVRGTGHSQEGSTK